MSRGPWPKKAIELVLPVAEARGFVLFCRRERGSVCDIMILGAGRTTIVRIARTKNLRGSPADIAAQFAGAVAGVRAIPSDPGRVCEIWACNYYRSIRFFRVERAGLVEIDRDGKQIGGDTPGTPPPSAVGAKGVT